ncbi:YiiD C-terminal domain-containing protein [Chitinimonas naiadis]
MSRDWQNLLRSSMPLADAMGVEVALQHDGRIGLSVPLGPNVNDKGTGFGGSVAALATLAGWVEMQRQLDLATMGSNVEIVVQRGETRYLRPIRDTFLAIAEPPSAEAVQKFLRLYERKGLARLSIEVIVYCAGERVAGYGGDYVASRV